MERRIFQCDRCGAQQETPVYWFYIEINSGHDTAGGATLRLSALGSTKAVNMEKRLHLCGQQCAIRTVSDFMDTSFPGSIKAPEDEMAVPHEEQQAANV